KGGGEDIGRRRDRLSAVHRGRLAELDDGDGLGGLGPQPTYGLDRPSEVARALRLVALAEGGAEEQARGLLRVILGRKQQHLDQRRVRFRLTGVVQRCPIARLEQLGELLAVRRRAGEREDGVIRERQGNPTVAGNPVL